MFGSAVAPDGLAYVDGDTSRRVTSPVAVGVTERRIVFAAAGRRGGDAGSLDYADLASVHAEDGQIVFVTRESVRCEVSLPDDEPGVDAVEAHLRWVGAVRSDAEACRGDVKRIAGEIRDHASAMEWEKAEMKYAEGRGALDRLIVRLVLTDPVPDGSLAPEITGLERTLERAYAEMLVDRAEWELDLAEQLLESGEFDRLRSAVRDAERYHNRARSHAATLERGDSFRFGEQREIYGALDRAADRIGATAERILGRAREEAQRAEAAADPETEVEHLEASLERYRDVQYIESDVGAGDVEAEVRRLEETLAEARESACREGTPPDNPSRQQGASGDASRDTSPPAASGSTLALSPGDGASAGEQPTEDDDTHTGEEALVKSAPRSEAETE